MRKKFFYFIAGLGLVSSPLWAQTGVAVSTVPEGYFSFTFPATGSGNLSYYLSLPLANSPAYSGAVSSLTNTTITVGDSPAPWTAGALTGTTPYFVKFLSGAESGRVLKVLSNTASTLTLDTTDNTAQTVALTTSGFTVQAGDTFELFVGDTLASVFGDNSTQNPLVLTGGANALNADTVAIYNATITRWQTYFFNTTTNTWALYGANTNANANATPLYPYCALTVLRRANEVATTLTLTGRVAEVPMLTKTTGSDVDIYSSTKYASDVTLAQLQFSNWTQAASPLAADTLAVWDPTMTRFDTYYQLPDSTWRKYGVPNTDASGLVIPAGSIVSILKRAAVSGAASFLQSALPYSVN